MGDTFAGVMKREETKAAEAAAAAALRKKCISGTPTGEQCLLRNQCHEVVHMVCTKITGRNIVHHKMEVPPHTQGFTDIVFCHCETSSAFLALPKHFVDAKIQPTSAIHKLASTPSQK